MISKIGLAVIEILILSRIQNSTTDIQIIFDTGTFIRKFSYRDFIENGYLYRPTCVDVDSELNIYFGDKNNLIQKFSPASVFIKQWGSAGIARNKLNSIGSISIDANDQIFVAYRGNLFVK